MQILIEEICQHIRNYFSRYENGDVYAGDITIENGLLSVNGVSLDIPSGRYFRILNSAANDGVYISGTDIPTDEEFKGEIWLMHPTAAFLALASEIGEWQTANGGAGSENMSPYSSESFGGYSYSKGSRSAGGGTATTWQGQYASRLNAWRKI